MKRLLVAAAAILAAAAFFPASAQQPAPSSSAVGAPPGSRMLVPAPGPAIGGGQIGVPTYVVPPAAEGGLLDVGQAFNQAMAPFINAAIQALLAAGLGWLAYVLKKKWNVNISQEQQQTVQTWLTNQASSLIADGAVSVAVVDGKPSVHVDEQALTAHAQQYAEHIPDAAAYFGLTPEALAAKIIDKIPQVPAGAQMIAAAH